jgi:hypothetical protein
MAPFPRTPELWHRVGSELLVRDGAGWRVYSVAAAPLDVRELYGRIFSVAGLCARPELVWLASAAGSVGFAVPGLVAVGANDLLDLTRCVAEQAFRGVSRPRANLIRLVRPTQRVYGFEEMWWGCLQFVLAHELGHQRQIEQHVLWDRVALEADADDFAGRIAEALGWDAALQMSIAHTAGATGPSGARAHPPPDGRVGAYRRGRNVRRLERALAAGRLRP